MNNKRITKQQLFAFAKWRQCGARQIVFTLLAMMAVAVIALGCGWGFFSDHSVRFNYHNDARQFYRLPPLPDLIDPKTGQWKLIYDSSTWESENVATTAASIAPQPEEFWQQAETAEQHGALIKTQTALRSFLAATTKEEAIEELRQKQINSANDRLDAMTATKQGARERDVMAYLSLRRELDKAMDSLLRVESVVRPQSTAALSFATPTVFWTIIETAQNTTEVSSAIPTNVQELLYLDSLEKVTSAKPPRSLQDNYAYLKAAFLYRLERFDEAKVAFEQVVNQYPNSEKREAAMYMITVVAMKISDQKVTPDCGDGIGSTDEERTRRRTNCQDENWRAALRAMTQLLRDYPRGKFATATLENRAAWLRRSGELALGVADYYRLLGHPSDVRVRLKGKDALRFIGEDLGTNAILNQIEAELADDPSAALAYTYHRIYNHAVDYSYDVAYSYSDNYEENQKEEERVSESHNKAQQELQHIANFATAMMRRHSTASVSGAFVLRVAQAQTELQNFREALPLAAKALSLNVSGNLRAEALWIKGSAEHKLKDFKAARATFTRLVNEFPQSHLTEGARRLSAMTAEDQGDFETALEQYLALHYDYDVAYFVDVLLATDRLAKFVANHKQVAQYNELLYALGVRYMRDKRWNEARATLQQVQTKPGPRSEDWQIAGTPPRSSFDKAPDWEWREKPYIKMSWVMQDLKAIEILERLEQAIATAQGDEAKAEAMYQLASYQFDADSLLFYNPVAWRGERYWLLSDLDGSDLMRLPNESQMIFNYSQSHETLARAIPIYLEIVDRFPQTKTAKDALYTAAVAHQHLSNLNPYWRSIYGQGLFVGSRLVTYADVRRTYPNYQLPRGTNGWEASTRTVNGGPGWSPPPPKPKPVPKPTRAQRFKRMLKRVVAEWHTTLQQKVDAIENRYTTLLQRCLNLVCWVIGLMGAWYAGILGLHIWKQRLVLEEPDLTGLFAVDVPPDSLPNSESRVEKVIGND